MILVDTDVLITNLRGIDAARDWLRHTRTQAGRLAVSVVTNAEIVGGMHSPESRPETALPALNRAQAVRVPLRFATIPWRRSACRCAQIRDGDPWRATHVP
ncbi:MAG: hypothetical protein ACRDSZ_00995 [Pseudonocardiaceae bacterium]